MNKVYFLLLFISTSAFAQIESELFEQVFGQSKIETKIELLVQDKSLGDIDVLVSGDKVVSVEKVTLYKKLDAILKNQYMKTSTSNSKWILTSQLPYKITYDVNNLKIKMLIPINELKPIFYDLDANPKFKYIGESISPAPISGSFNYTLDKNYGDEYLGGENFSAYISSFINMHSYVLNLNGYYQERNGDLPESYWARQNFNLTKDFTDIRLRAQLGDTNSGRFGFMQSFAIGGVNIRKQFSIDPYNRPYSQGEKEFQIFRRSKVKTYVNGTLVKSEVLPAGNYQLSNLPLINGINNVRVEIDDDIGPKKILEFNIPISISILKKGEFDYSLSSGRRTEDLEGSRNYKDESFASGFLQYGFTDIFSAGGYFQLDDSYSLAGAVSGFSSDYGNFFLGNAFSNNSNLGLSGIANALTWQYQNIAGAPFSGVSMILRYENFINDFRSSSSDLSASIKNNYEINLSFPVYSGASFNVGGGISDYEDNSFGEKSYLRTSLNFRATNNLNVSIYASSTKSAEVSENNSLSAFFTWNFDESNHYVSAFRDFKADSTRIALTKDNSNQLYEPRYTVAVSEDESDKRVNLSSQVPTPMADFFFRSSYAKDDDNEEYKQIGFGVSTSTLFAYDNELAFAISRSNQSSFAIFKPSAELEDQKIVIRSTSTFSDTESPILGDLALTNLVPYQYREIQVDPTKLDYGTSLEKEKFVVLPAYKSGHLIRIKSNGMRSIQGYLKINGKPVSLKVCQLGQSIFFTDRDGYFYIEGVREDINMLKINGKNIKEIKINSKDKGIVDLGVVNLKKDVQ